LAAAAELAASTTTAPSRKLTTRTWRARSAERKPSTSPASARRSRVFASTGCSSRSSERMRSSLG